jgi:hemerythrin
MISEEEFNHYFRFHDLKLGQWNDIDTLEVKPVFSPHPVETTVMLFRTMDRKGYRTYAHFADIVSLKLLKNMVTDDPEAPGLSQALYDEVCADYLEPADLKKLDIGGGMIHGDAEDFARDKSGKIVLAHTALPLTIRQKEIGSGAPFGMVDVLIPAHQDYVRSYAFHYLNTYFPTVAGGRLRVLLNCPVVKFNPESLILKAGRKAEYVYLILTGQVDVIRTRTRIFSTLSTGGLMGEYSALTQKASPETYRATNFVQALCIPVDLYAQFVKSNGLLEEMLRLQDLRSFLYTSQLFGDGLSCTLQNAIAETTTTQTAKAGELLTSSRGSALCLVKSGKVELLLAHRHIEILSPGDYYNESAVLFDTPTLFKARAAQDSTICSIPGEALDDVPIVRWKLLETHKLRLGKVISDAGDGSHVVWHEEFAVNVACIDQQHREIFAMARQLYAALFHATSPAAALRIFPQVIALTEAHFQTEEELMRQSGYSGYAGHRKKHVLIIKALNDFFAGYKACRATPKKEVGIFLKDWVMTHILTEDRQLGASLNRQGIL